MIKYSSTSICPLFDTFNPPRSGKVALGPGNVQACVCFCCSKNIDPILQVALRLAVVLLLKIRAALCDLRCGIALSLSWIWQSQGLCASTSTANFGSLVQHQSFHQSIEIIQRIKYIIEKFTYFQNCICLFLFFKIHSHKKPFIQRTNLGCLSSLLRSQLSLRPRRQRRLCCAARA